MDDETKSKQSPKTKTKPPIDEKPRRRRIEDLPEAVDTLRVKTVNALRARCRRAAAAPDENGNAVVAKGAHAIKVGKHWRIEYV